MSNPFGEAPPQKPTRPARPPPPNPFGPARQVSVDASKPTSKNPFGSTEPEYPPLPSMSVPLPTVSAPTVPVIPLRPPTPPTIPPETPPAFPPALQAPEILAPSTVPPPLPEDVPPSTPLVAPPAPPLPPSLPPSTPTGAPPPPPAIPPSTPTARAPPPPALPPASPTFSTVEMPENHAPPVPALLPQQTAIESDGFDFQPVAPQSDPFGFPAPNAAPVAVAFDAAAGSNSFAIPQTAPLSVSTAAGLTRTAPAVVVEEPPSLPPPPPQVDDDPYDLHINRPAPVPQPPIATAAPQPRKSFTEDKKHQSKSASGDPFSELVAPLKPTPPPGVSNPFAKPANPLDSLPLNALLAAKQTSIAAAQVAPTSSAPAAFVGAPVAVTASAPVRVATADPFSAPAVPFAAPSVSAAPEDFDLFDQLTAPRAAAPVAPPAAPPVPVISPADFDIFAAKAKPAAVAAKTAAVTAPVDPFAGPIDPFASSQSGAPVVEDDAFDVFGLPKPAPTQQKRPSHTLPVPPVPAKAAVAHKAAPAPKATVPPPLETSQPVISHAKRQASTTAPTAAPPEPEFIFSPADYRKTNSQSFDLVADDPFASSVAPAHANDLFDDPFATHADPRDKEEIDDPLARLRQTYGLSAQHSDDEDEHHHDPSDVLHDAFDDFDDFTFDQAHHGGRTAARPGGDLSRPTKQSASGRSAGSAATSKSAGSASSGGVDEDGVLAQGEILSRLSTKAMLTRDWHDTYYAIVKDHLYVFRHRADYFQYQAQAQNRRVQRGSTEDASPLYKKRIDLVYNLKLEPIKGKEYKTLGMVYNFSLELIEDYGPKDLGKFGSTDRETVQTLWNHIRDVVMAKRKERAAPRPTYG